MDRKPTIVLDQPFPLPPNKIHSTIHHDKVANMATNPLPDNRFRYLRWFFLPDVTSVGLFYNIGTLLMVTSLERVPQIGTGTTKSKNLIYGAFMKVIWFSKGIYCKGCGGKKTFPFPLPLPVIFDPFRKFLFFSIGWICGGVI